MTLRYAGMFQIDDFTEPGSAKRLDRVALTSNDGQVHYDEGKLQSLLAIHPQALPIGDIEPFLADAVPVCTELGTFAGPVDLVLVTPHGDIVLVECKLWRNPQARREVVGQIIDYAKELPRLSFEAFDIAVRKASPAGQAAKTDSLYQRSGAETAGIDEASFVDAVARNLRRGRFLLLIVGDGIREGCKSSLNFSSSMQECTSPWHWWKSQSSAEPKWLPCAASRAGEDGDGTAWRRCHQGWKDCGAPSRIDGTSCGGSVTAWRAVKCGSRNHFRS